MNVLRVAGYTAALCCISRDRTDRLFVTCRIGEHPRRPDSSLTGLDRSALAYSAVQATSRSPHRRRERVAAGDPRHRCGCCGRRDPMMDRRAFIGSLALGTLAAPRAAPAQPARKVYRIGILSLGTTSDMVGPQPRHPAVNAFLRGLRELGYVYGRAFRDRATRGRRQARALPQPGRRTGPSPGGRDCRRRANAARAQTGDLDDPRRHGGRRRPCGRGYSSRASAARAGTSRG